jgi:hypothetical protein
MVYRREIDDQAVSFGHQGAVWRNAMTMFDHLTGSVWSQPYGTPFAGELLGSDAELGIIPSTLTTWGDWKEKYPETLAYARTHEDTDRYDTGPAVFDRSSILIDYFDDVVSYPVSDLRSVQIVNDTVGGVEVAVVYGLAGDDLWSVVARQLPDGTLLDFSLGEGGVLADPVTGSTWDPTHGFGIEGPLSEQTVNVLPASMIYADKFTYYYPEGRVWGPDS